MTKFHRNFIIPTFYPTRLLFAGRVFNRRHNRTAGGGQVQADHSQGDPTPTATATDGKARQEGDGNLKMATARAEEPTKGAASRAAQASP
jgi:hypothetical protein